MALGVAEGVLRATEPPVYRPTTGEYGFVNLSRQPEVWAFRPNTVCRFVWDGDPFATLPEGAAIEYRINSLGMRGTAPGGTGRRVLVIGDSFAFGEGVVLEDTFVVRTQELLRKGDTPDAVLLNAGVPGYGTPQAAFRLPGWLEQTRPAAVVLVFNPNDPIPLQHAFDQVLGHDAAGDLLTTRGKPPTGLRLAALWRAAAGARQSEDWYLSYYRGSQQSYWTRSRQLLGAMRHRAREAGATFAVALFPLLHRLDARPLDAVHQDVAQACRELDVPFLDLSAAFEGRDERDLWVHPIDHHPNARAHELAAEHLAPFVGRLLR